jgi:pimeloyl-ACP methyl ester carboxylesterase
VTVTDVPITAAGITTHYLAIRRSSGSPESVYLNLHYLGAPVRVDANQLRMNELAIARNTLILVPQAPSASSSLIPPGTIELPNGDLFNPFLPDTPIFVGNVLSLSRWPNSVLEPMVADIETLLDAVVADGRSKFGGNGKPLYVTGYSNGGVMGLLYACARPGSVDAVLAAAANLEEGTADSCSGVGMVLVHGTNDALASYEGSPPFRYGTLEAYSVLKTNNGCGADRTATIDDAGPLGGIPIEFLYTDRCSSGKRMFAVTADGGGHTWPAQDDDTSGLDFNTFGPIPRAWDATIYGYDLLKLAGG